MVSSSLDWSRNMVEGRIRTMCDLIGLFDFRNLPESNRTPTRNPRFYGVLQHFRLRTVQIHFRNLPESTASEITLGSAFRKNPEIANTKNTGKTALFIPIPEESGNALAPAMGATRQASHAPTTTPTTAPAATTTTMKVATANTIATTMTILPTNTMMTTTTTAT